MRETARPWRPTPLIVASVAWHAAVIGWGLRRPTVRWRAALGAIAANHGVICAATLLPQTSLLGPNVERIPPDAGASGEVFLTFDDGPDPERTLRVLDLLDEGEATASFFCIGRRAQRHPDVVREIAERGHGVENHTWSHSHSFAFSMPPSLASEVDRCQEILAELSGRTPGWFRAPAGMRNPFLDPILCRRGLHLISWTRRALDALDTDPERISRRLLRGVRSGDVLLLHDGPPELARHRAPVLEVVPRLLEGLDAAGLVARVLPPADRVVGA